MHFFFLFYVQTLYSTRSQYLYIRYQFTKKFIDYWIIIYLITICIIQITYFIIFSDFIKLIFWLTYGPAPSYIATSGDSLMSVDGTSNPSPCPHYSYINLKKSIGGGVLICHISIRRDYADKLINGKKKAEILADNIFFPLQ